MKKLFLSLSAMIALAASAQAQNTVLLADTAFTTTMYNGNKVSQISAPTGTLFGSNMSTVSTYYMGEDFVIPAGQSWKIDTLIVYGYQTGSSTTSTFTGATLALRQGSVTGTTVFGDTLTNRMSSTAFTGIFRTTDVDTTNTQRPIMAVKIALVPAPTLTAGTYWAVWSTSGSLASGPWCPPKVLPGRTNPSGQNGMQFTGSWIQAVDGADNLGFNMLVKGSFPCSTVSVNLGRDTAFCSGSSISLNAGNAGATYLWSTGATTQSIAVNTSGTYTVAVTTPAGCVGRDTIQVTVNPKPVVNLGGNSAICSGMSHTLNAGNPGATYLWNTGATTQTINVTTTGTYKVSVTSAGGCVSQDSAVVTVKPTPVVNLGPDTIVCSGNPVTLDAGNSGASYLWSTGATTQSISVNTSGTYSVQVTNAAGCDAQSAIDVTVRSMPVAGSISVTNQSPTFGFIIGGTKNDAFQGWNFGDGSIDTTGRPIVTHTYRANGTYTVTFYAINECGIDSVSVIVTVQNAGVNDVDLDGTVSLFPNPASGFVTVRNASHLPMKQITILNTIGAVVRQEAATGNAEQRLDVKGLAAGIYQVRIELEGATLVQKLYIRE